MSSLEYFDQEGNLPSVIIQIIHNDGLEGGTIPLMANMCLLLALCKFKENPQEWPSEALILGDHFTLNEHVYMMWEGFSLLHQVKEEFAKDDHFNYEVYLEGLARDNFLGLCSLLSNN